MKQVNRTFNESVLRVANRPIEVCHSFFGSKSIPDNFTISLGGRRLVVRPSPALSHFKDVCLLGADFCALYDVRATIDYRSKQAVLMFR